MKISKWILILLLITGCELVVDFDIPVGNPMLVVNALVNPDSTWQVSVSKSRHILDRMPAQIISDAVVTITDEQNNLISTLMPVGLGYYRSDQKPLAGVSYKLSTVAQGYNAVSAQTNIPLPVPISAITLDTLSGNDGYSDVTAEITFMDPPEKNYYQVYLSAEMIVQVWTPTEIKTDTVSYLFPLYLSQSEFEESTAVFNDFKFNGTLAKVKVKLNYWTFGTVLKQHIILLHLSEAYYKYELTRSLQERTQGDPFAQPVQVFNNITNGLGIFAGSAGYAYKVE
jgi:hypothetical protein